MSPTSNESSPDRDRVTNVFTNPQNKEDDLPPLPQIKKRSSITRSLSSLISREKYPKIEQKPFSPTCKNQESRTETTTVLHKIDEKKEIAEEILSSFVDEKAVFEALIDLEGTAFEKFEGAYPPTFILSLRELTFQRFPGRVENLKLALAEYDKKTKNIPPSASIITLTTKQVADYWLLKQLLPSDLVNACMLFQYWLNNSELAYLQGLKLALNPEEGGMLNFPWSLSNAHRFASALYLRDAATFQAINPGDILLDLINKDHASKEAIITLTENYTTTVNAWTSQIVNEKDEKNKKTLIKNFAYLERYLHKTHNYHGASQVDACLTRISHLWATNPALNPSNIDPYWTSVNEAMAHNHNHKLYREQLIRSQNEPTYLPIFMVIVHDLGFLLESSFSEEPEKVLPGLAIALEPLLKLKMITPLNHFSSLIKKEADNPFLEHICTLSKIDEGTLNKLSFLNSTS
ncbi:MAG: RasGEF domain-containing protein [Candidatus Paracaedibacter sp.]